MITIETNCSNTISCPIGNIESIVYDGHEYALLRHNRNTITRLNEEKCPIDTQRTMHYYTSICFDKQESCYYVCTKDHPTAIFKLDLNFRALGKASIASGHDQSPCAISKHPSKPLLFLLYPNEILSWDMIDGTIKNIYFLDQDKHVMDIIALENGFILSYRFKNKTFIEVHCLFCEKCEQYCIPINHQLDSMIFMERCYNEQQGDEIYIIQLILTNCETQEQTSTELQIACNAIEKKPCPNHFSCEGGKNEIIHSIALEEAGIAHILNAEGEKLQKAVASDTTIEELLMVNESVRKTITQITLLEGQLYSKLESLQCLCVDEQLDEE